MDRCPRCERYHRGICGIPPGAVKGYGVRGVKGADRTALSRRSRGGAKGTGSLEGLLGYAKEQVGKVTELLRLLPTEAPEYGQLLEKEQGLDRLIKELLGQIAVAKGAK